jgi:hypothetical protein
MGTFTMRLWATEKETLEKVLPALIMEFNVVYHGLITVDSKTKMYEMNLTALTCKHHHLPTAKTPCPKKES